MVQSMSRNDTGGNVSNSVPLSEAETEVKVPLIDQSQLSRRRSRPPLRRLPTIGLDCE